MLPFQASNSLKVYARSFSSFTARRASLRLGECSENFTSVLIDDNLIRYNNVFLRDACTQPESVDPFSRQKLFTTAQISKGLKSTGARIENDSLVVDWSNPTFGSITSSYSKEFLLKHKDLDSSLKQIFFNDQKHYWTRKDVESSLADLQVTYKDYFEGNGFDKTLNNLNKFGFQFVNDIPKPSETNMNEANAEIWPVSKLATKFGYIKKTFYGTLFDVKNEKEEAKNIANTSTFLPLHMDLCYYESPPGLQLLHVIDNSTLGGENIFADSFKIAELVKVANPEAYKALLEFPITFHYDNNNEYYYYTRPLIVEDPLTGHIKELNYSPPFQGPFERACTDDKDSELFSKFLEGFELFESLMNDPVNQFQLKMKEGSCVIFDNRRVLHSRNEFSDENGGDRWLMGCYVDGDSYRSKLRIANRQK
ncbi:probable oxidoreductase Aim17p [[Candida] railenensis]|uniref:Probable oxidoreductase Aim17p n=1 Tax=[Candida] railenensis TaxID=45579 RepID=A0A9P0QVB8_9ASCO|nr:probable oxidoreductase Aim17p [[Candida] railenensis]